MTEEMSEDDLSRIVTAVETIETSLGILAEKRTLGRDAYKRDRETQVLSNVVSSINNAFTDSSHQKYFESGSALSTGR